jgi:hypothetical protein
MRLSLMQILEAAVLIVFSGSSISWLLLCSQSVQVNSAFFEVENALKFFSYPSDNFFMCAISTGMYFL